MLLPCTRGALNPLADVDTLAQDIRYAARKLIRSPAFTAIVVATLALATGATTAVFSIVNGVLLKPLPLRTPEQIVGVGLVAHNAGELASISAPDYLDYRARNHSFIDIAAFYTGNVNLTVRGAAPVRLQSNAVHGDFFGILGAPMERGRPLQPGDDAHGADPVAVISDHVWRSVFNADSSIVGKVITVNAKPVTVVGVASPQLVYPEGVDVWQPFELEPWMIDPQNRGAHWLDAVARLRPGVTLDAAKRDMAGIGDQLRALYPESNATARVAVESLDDIMVGNVRRALWTMFGAVAFVLLIACANVANLLLIRASARETEMALRTALGAGRWRIVRQLITESVLLSIAGAALGCLLASWSLDLIARVGGNGLPRLSAVGVDARVLGFSVLVAALTGLLFGLVPALYAARPELGQMLRDSGRSASARRSSGIARSALVVAEMTLAVVLLVGAGLMIRSYMNLMSVNPGFHPEHVLSFNVSLSEAKYPYDRDRNRFADAVVDALSHLPGSQAAAVALSRPMQTIAMRSSFDIDGRPKAPNDARLLAAVRPVSSEYFRVLGIPLRVGRLFTHGEERWGPPPVVVVSEAFAKKYFPNESPIGKRITLGVDHDTAVVGKSAATSRGEIVGVVADIKQNKLDETPYPAVYLPYGTFPEDHMAFFTRTDASVDALAPAIRSIVSHIDPEMPLYDLTTMTAAISESAARPRFYTSLLAGFAGLALLLAALGIYGVIAYGVSLRMRELGIRVALGATGERIQKLVLGQGLLLTIIGVVCGTIGALALTRLLSSLLFGVSAADAVTFVLVPITLGAVAVLASWLPARRAARVDPLVAMRSE